MSGHDIPLAMTVDRYLQHRRRWEVCLWPALFGVDIGVNVGVIWLEMSRLPAAGRFGWWEPVVWEATSALVTLGLVPALLAVDRRFPLDGPRGNRVGLAHLLATIPFSLVHVLGMVAARELIYASLGGDYRFGPWPRELFYEYLKDFRSYWVLIGLIYLYRFVLRRWQGEAEFLSLEREQPA